MIGYWCLARDTSEWTRPNQQQHDSAGQGHDAESSHEAQINPYGSVGLLRDEVTDTPNDQSDPIEAKDRSDYPANKSHDDRNWLIIYLTVR